MFHVDGTAAAAQQTVIKNMTVFSGACPNCKQVLTWDGWSRHLSDSERLEHINGGCRAPNYCHRCKAQLGGG